MCSFFLHVPCGKSVSLGLQNQSERMKLYKYMYSDFYFCTAR